MCGGGGGVGVGVGVGWGWGWGGVGWVGEGVCVLSQRPHAASVAYASRVAQTNKSVSRNLGSAGNPISAPGREAD